MHKLLISFHEWQVSGLIHKSELTGLSVSDIVRSFVGVGLSSPYIIPTCSGAIYISGYLVVPEYKQ